MVESMHGTLRQLFLAPLVGDFQARRIAVFTGIALVLLTAVVTVRWLDARDSTQSLGVGALWVALTVAFEIALGRAVLGYGWSRIIEDYDLSRGGLMGVGLIAMLFTPLVAARIRGPRAAAL
ncbi:MAG: hypothetical protein U1F30_10960 [Steroidobacteraceae bacterium]